MNVLVMDTSTDRIVLGLKKNEDEFFFIGEAGSKRHNVTLLSEVDGLLAKNGLSVRDVDVFGVVVGPGSFTGIRIGVATVNGLSMACGAKIVELTSLEQLDDGSEQLVVLDCKHGNYYAGQFGQNVEYFETTQEQLSARSGRITYLTESNPSRILRAAMRKISRGEYVSQAKPFYMKKSSAER